MRNRKRALAVLVLLAWLWNSPAVLAPAEKPATVLLVSFDGFRWDYARMGLTPNIDRLKTEGASALSLQPVFPSTTFPSHFSIITGMYPESHGIISNSFFDPYSGKAYSLQDKSAVCDGRWYLGEAFWETAERNGIKTASFFWPGSEIDLDYRHPSYFKAYDSSVPYEHRIRGVIDWLGLPDDQRPRFIILYFHETDSAGHTYGPGAEETKKAIRILDEQLGILLRGLEAKALLGAMDILLVSDHGMTEIDPDRTIPVRDILDPGACRFQNHVAYMLVEPNPGRMEEVHRRLLSKRSRYSVYKRVSVPGHFHFSRHPFISSLVVMADLGWTFRNDDDSFVLKGRGFHGYDNHLLDMHGIFFAKGPSFKRGFETGTLWSVDVYPLLCEIFGIEGRSNIDGRLDRISCVLRDGP